MTLLELKSHVITCRLCELCTGRTHAVPGDGMGTARVMLVGEAPGRNEDLAGKPFVGAAGQVLSTALKKAGWSREELYITNLVKCRPPHNRDPLPDELAACRPYFLTELELISPLVVILLGRHALESIAPLKKISLAHGQPFYRQTESRWYCPAYHPAATLYSPNLRNAFEQDILAAKACFDAAKITHPHNKGLPNRCGNKAK